MSEHITDIGRRRVLNLYKRTGRYHNVLYAHTTVEIGPILIKVSRWHDKKYDDGNPYKVKRLVDRRDYHVEFGYHDGNEDGILNPNAQWMFHR
jgi:hypothetical protein